MFVLYADVKKKNSLSIGYHLLLIAIWNKYPSKFFRRRPKLLIIFAHLAAKKQGALLNLTLLFQNRVNLSPSQLLMHTSQDYHG